MFPSKLKQHENQILENQFASDEKEREKERQRKLTYQRFRLSCEFTHNILDDAQINTYHFHRNRLKLKTSPIILFMNNLMSGYYYTQSIRVDGIEAIASQVLKLTIYLISLW